MPLIVAKNAGFCVGVKSAVGRALETATACRSAGAACYSLGALINNPLVVDELAAQGMHAVDRPAQARNGVLVIRSHGVTPETLKEACANAARVVDCTCPFVSRVHRMVKGFSQKGEPVIIVGDKDHPEIRGIAGWCEGDVFVVSSGAEIDALPQSAANALVVVQTTFQPELFDALTLRLKERFPALRVMNTICGATKLRQSEAAQIAKSVNRMVVVGGKNSANTRKLYETCLQYCPNTYLVERAAELPSHLLHPEWELIGVTAGASTPDWSLKEVVNSMNDIERNAQVEPEVTQDQIVSEPQEVLEAQESAPSPQEPEAVDSTDAGEAAPLEAHEPAAEAEDAPEAQEEAPAAEKEAEPQPEKSFMDQVADSIARIRPGQTIEGKVVQITDDEVCVNIGFKSDGLIKRSELVDKDVQLGDTIEVEIVKVNDGEGNVILSQRNIINRKLWDELMAKYESGEFVDAVGKEAVKGGLLASINGVRAFVPASHLAQRYIDKISQFVGQPMKLKIIEVDSSKKRVVASRKAVLAEENARLKSEAWEHLHEGEIVKGIVRRFAPFGAFVDLGGVDGLIHVSDLSWSRSATPADVLSINQEIDVKILSLDMERERIQLGYKQLQPRPWDNVEDKYPVGSVLTRNVVRIRPFGAFIELEPGVDGLCHISQVSLTRVNKVEDVLTPGQEVNVKVLSVDPEAKRISLSIREAMEDSAFDYSEDIPGFEMFEGTHDGFAADDDAVHVASSEDVVAESDNTPAEKAAEVEEEAVSKEVTGSEEANVSEEAVAEEVTNVSEEADAEEETDVSEEADAEEETDVSEEADAEEETDVAEGTDTEEETDAQEESAGEQE
ncbi:MAG: bifunctional 4-hydroxy-3-methylbut-2-enyl diphosphate reductase/30S ribosomal protein S1 [Eubacteriales bacterium]|nr:bifunctional 4-hydroxy-3-methylbut-2-enyl diphosphate reductase/30S ribosomal protein S1 [Eubacteriales bacterium]MDD4105656.1 bifunctional 4-hydroxy-3-methylbut-2-enyl diphosphate reductase/30S ribosomal protein S1 [Eubacteriales bacterium]MDD4711133.1 bifunctional 4-hydroxy-3-methylbut-2-enyl diphosphate reductase/30S ribosomal protein S1 [Eubacteriales bacterium]NLO15154.1 bifunctional 4-hydroxy-3-methylbut-2-enyl diphosphate reductase/30S ribosomal protein S1 [Clostridiales bacterium]